MDFLKQASQKSHGSVGVWCMDDDDEIVVTLERSDFFGELNERMSRRNQVELARLEIQVPDCEPHGSHRHGSGDGQNEIRPGQHPVYPGLQRVKCTFHDSSNGMSDLYRILRRVSAKMVPARSSTADTTHQGTSLSPQSP
jgi:hypothetical protein